MANSTKLTCARSKDRGTCNNGRKIDRVELEGLILNALKSHLLDEELCQEFSKAYVEHLNTLRINHNAQRAGFEAELKRIKASDDKIVKAVIEGYSNEAMKKKMNANQIRKDELKLLLKDTEDAPVLIHPNMAQRYKLQITELIKSFHDKSNSKHISELLRSLIDKIVLTPNESNPDGNKNALRVDLFGDLAGILSLASNGEKSLISKNLSNFETQLVAGERLRLSLEDLPETQLVAGVGFEPTTFRL